MVEKRGVDRDVVELIVRTWRLIDYISERLDDPSVNEADKIRWAGVLASAIGTLNKLFYKAGIGKLSKDDMAILLSKIPKKFSEIVMGRMRKTGGSRTKNRKRFWDRED